MFESIVGNRRIVEYLRRAVQNGAVSHAYVLSGPPGVLKTETARLLARYLMCEAQGSVPCGVCAGCRLAEKGNHPDFHIVSRRLEHGLGVESSQLLREDKAPKSISVDCIREVKNDVQVMPFRAPKKVYLVEEADLMTVSAQNSFLKILEEPPEYAVILLVTSRKSALLDTVLSRCVELDFTPLQPEEIETCLLAEFPGRQEAAKLAALLCGGNLDRAKQLMENENAGGQGSQAFELLQLLLLGTPAQWYDAYVILEKQKDGFAALAEQMLAALRDAISYKLSQPQRAVFSDKQELLSACAKAKPLGRLISMEETLLDAKRKYEQNANYNLLITQMILDINGEEIHDRSRWSAV